MTLPPGPRSPALLQIGRWIVQPLEMLAECHRKFGDAFTFKAPRGARFLILANPEHIKQVVTADPATLLAGQGNATLLEPMLGKFSVLTLDGADHLRQRRLLLPAFHGDRMQAYAAVMREICDANLQSWPLREPFALHAMMTSITLDVILRTVFGLASGGKHAELRASLVELLEIATNPWLIFPGLIGLDPFKVPWLRITKLKTRVDRALYDIIRDRRRRQGSAELTLPPAPSLWGPTGGADVLSMMLEARDEAGAGMSDVEVRDELVTLLLAGHETTATSLAWTFDQLLSHPATLERLRDELAAGRDEYLDAVIRETLRIRPIVPMIGRVVAKPYQLGPWSLPVGTRVAPSIYLAGRRPDAYPDPDRFKPERWLGVKPDPYTWLPFGGGIRRCIGMAFAQLEMRVVIEHVVTRTRLSLVDGQAKVVRRGITLAPQGGTRVRLEERRREQPTAA